MFAASLLYIYLLDFSFLPNYPIDVELTNCFYLSNCELVRRRGCCDINAVEQVVYSLVYVVCA